MTQVFVYLVTVDHVCMRSSKDNGDASQSRHNRVIAMYAGSPTNPLSCEAFGLHRDSYGDEFDYLFCWI